MIELILFLIPSVVYFFIQENKRRLGRLPAAKRIGATWGTGSDYLVALALVIPLGVLGYVAIMLISTEAPSTPGVSVAKITSIAAELGIALRALGEEIFFADCSAGYSSGDSDSPGATCCSR